MCLLDPKDELLRRSRASAHPGNLSPGSVSPPSQRFQQSTQLSPGSSPPGKSHLWHCFRSDGNCVRSVIYISNGPIRYVVFPSSLQGQCHEIFCFWFFSWISFSQATEYTIRAVSNFFENSRRYSQLKVDHRYQRHRWQILPPVSLVFLIPVANLPPVSTIPVCLSFGGKLINEKNQKRKISWHCPFKMLTIFNEGKSIFLLNTTCLVYKYLHYCYSINTLKQISDLLLRSGKKAVIF